MAQFEVTIKADAMTITVEAEDEEEAEQIGLARWNKEYNIDQVYAEPITECEHETVVASTSDPAWEGYECIKCGETFDEAP